MEGVVVQEDVQPLGRPGADFIGERLGILPGEVRLDQVLVAGQLALQPVPVVLVVAQVDEQGDLVCSDQRDAVLDDRLEQLALRAGAAHGDQEAPRLVVPHAPRRAAQSTSMFSTSSWSTWWPV